MRIYNGSVPNGPILPAHLSTATFPLQSGRQNQMSQHLNFGVNHAQGVYRSHSVSQRDANLTDSDDDRSISPASPSHDHNSKSQQGF